MFLNKANFPATESRDTVFYTFLVFCILFMMILIVGGIQNNSFSSSRPSSVSWYQVQTSLNGSDWRYVGCPRDGDAAHHCSGALFDSSDATSDPSLIVTRRFPEPHQARYLRIVPELWNQVGVNTPEMRLDVFSEGTADHVHGSLVDFVIIDEPWVYNFMYVLEMDVWEATEMRKNLHGLNPVTCAVRKNGDYAAGLS